MLLNKKKERIRFYKFLAVGIISSIVDFGLMNVFTLVVNFPLVSAQALSFIIAVINSFLWNHYWTYPDSRSKSPIQKFMQFAIVNIVGIGIRTITIPWFYALIYRILVNNKINLFLPSQIISQNLSLAIAILIVMMWNFIINRFWTFNDIDKNVVDHKLIDGDSKV